MIKHICNVCGYVYEDDHRNDGIPFDEQDDSYLCPVCGMPKSEFKEVNTKN